MIENTTTNTTLRTINLNRIVGLLVMVTLMWVYPSTTTYAADYTVSTAAELINAINTANGDAAADRIILNANITVANRITTLPAPADATITIIQGNYNFHGHHAFPPHLYQYHHRR